MFSAPIPERKRMVMNVVVGAGGTGAATAELLAAEGCDVRLITRRGAGPVHPRIRRIALDASNETELTAAIRGASVLFNCAAPPYAQWHTHSLGLASAILNAAIATQVDYVMLGNLYGYGAVDGPMTEDLPLRPNTRKGALRAQIWHQAKAVHDSCRIRVTEVRASDFIGRGATSVYTEMVVPSIIARRPAWFPADLDAPHSWSSTVDTARALVTVANSPSAWGHPWHAPTNPPLSTRELSVVLACCLGVPEPKLHRMPGWLLRVAGLGSRVLRELPEMQYQLRRPFVLDSSRMQGDFALSPTPFEDIVRDWLVSEPSARTR
jgi:nucleoside-diphosphate-sugar epimerase